ncbi:hypothetical protein OROGR_012002 [Orobanche gracilis]
METGVPESWRSAYFHDMLDLSYSYSDSESDSDSHAPMELSPKKWPPAEEREIQRQEWIKEARKNNDDTYKKWIDQKEKTLKQHWHEGDEEQIIEEEYFEAAYGTGTANLTQIYSLKLTTEGMNSLEVYGLIHVHSDTFNFYQVIFDRKRDNCLTLTEKDPYLVLTGPALPTFSSPNTIHIYGTLKLKSTTGSDDKYLSVSICCGDGKVSGIHKLKEGDVDFQSEEEYLSHVSKCCLPGKPCVHTPQDIGKHYLLEMTRGFIPFSLVATITVRVNNDGGSLVQNCCFTASTASFPDVKVVLFDSRDWKVSSVGMVQLSRRTICVESGGTLIVCIEHRDKGILKEVKFSSPVVDDVESVDMVRNETVEADLCTIDFKVIWSKYFRRFNAA